MDAPRSSGRTKVAAQKYAVEDARAEAQAAAEAARAAARALNAGGAAAPATGAAPAGAAAAAPMPKPKSKSAKGAPAAPAPSPPKPKSKVPASLRAIWAGKGPSWKDGLKTICKKHAMKAFGLTKADMSGLPFTTRAGRWADFHLYETSVPREVALEKHGSIEAVVALQAKHAAASAKAAATRARNGTLAFGGQPGGRRRGRGRYY